MKEKEGAERMHLGQADKEKLQKIWKLAENVLFPLILLLFPLLKANQGIDLTDTGYSLGNYRFFGQVGGVWTLLTFLSNVLGFLLTKLPMGGTMLGMKIYTSLIISGMALLGYRLVPFRYSIQLFDLFFVPFRSHPPIPWTGGSKTGLSGGGRSSAWFECAGSFP